MRSNLYMVREFPGLFILLLTVECHKLHVPPPAISNNGSIAAAGTVAPPRGSPTSSPAASSIKRPWRAQVSASCREERRRMGESCEAKGIAPAPA